MPKPNAPPTQSVPDRIASEIGKIKMTKTITKPSTISVVRARYTDQLADKTDTELCEIICESSSNPRETTLSMLETSKLGSAHVPGRWREFTEKLAAVHSGFDVHWDGAH